MNRIPPRLAAVLALIALTAPAQEMPLLDFGRPDVLERVTPSRQKETDAAIVAGAAGKALAFTCHTTETGLFPGIAIRPAGEVLNKLHREHDIRRLIGQVVPLLVGARREEDRASAAHRPLNEQRVLVGVGHAHEHAGG